MDKLQLGTKHDRNRFIFTGALGVGRCDFICSIELDGILRGVGSKPRHGMNFFSPSNDASTGLARKRTCKIGYLAYLLPLFTNYVDFMHDRCVFFQLHVGFSRVTCER